MITPFSCSRLPRILFGSGQFLKLPDIIKLYGQNVLLVTGARSFPSTARWPALMAQLAANGMSVEHVSIDREPSPQWVDDAVACFHGKGIQVVVSIGGGSALDAGKAIAGLLPHGHSVMDYLEGVGRNLPYTGPSLPFIAVPTTAGTGSEATKNAVLGVSGPNGFKKSFRHECLVAEYAIVDPDLLDTCPREQIIANGMDAFVQLMESCVSIQANPFTDALVWSGIDAFREGFWSALDGGESDRAQNGRSHLAYASLLSGITLAQTGLGSVHGLAAPLGAFYSIPHGLVCGTLMAEATGVNVQALRSRDPASPALKCYARLAEVLCEHEFPHEENAINTLLDLLRHWIEYLKIPSLAKLGVNKADIPHIVAHARGNSMKTNPITLTDDEIAWIIRARC